MGDPMQIWGGSEKGARGHLTKAACTATSNA